MEAWDDEILYFPRNADEVPARMRDTWQGEPIEGKLDGPDDPRIKKFEMRIEATLRFGMPRVLGLGKIAMYTSSSRKIRRNLYESVWFLERALVGNMIGIPLRLALRMRKAERWDEEKRAKIPTQVWEVVLDTPWEMQQAIDAVNERRQVLGAPPARLALDSGDGFFAGTDERRRKDAEAQLMEAAAGLTVPGDEEQLVREEPEATAMITEAQTNRIARLEEEYDGDTSTLLFGAYGVDRVEQLTEEQADVYEASLRRLIAHRSTEAEPEEIDGEVVEEGSFEDMLPPHLREQVQRAKDQT